MNIVPDDSIFSLQNKSDITNDAYLNGNLMMAGEEPAEKPILQPTKNTGIKRQ